MPQMSPMPWLIILLTMTMSFLILTMKLKELNKTTPKTQKIQKKNMKMKW